LATSPAASITPGFEVFVHEVIAAIKTEPCPISPEPFSDTLVSRLSYG